MVVSVCVCLGVSACVWLTHPVWRVALSPENRQREQPQASERRLMPGAGCVCVCVCVLPVCVCAYDACVEGYNLITYITL